MKFLPYLLKHLRRNWVRTASTVLAMAICIFLFCTLRSVLAAVDSLLESTSANRLITRHAVSLVFNLPLSYGSRIQSVPGVKRVAITSWFGGSLPAKKEGQNGKKGAEGQPDFSKFFTNLAVEDEPYFAMHSEYVVPPEEMEGLARQLMPFVVPILSYMHTRLLGQFVEQDVIGHMESDLAESSAEQGRLRVAILFADLAGYARLTVERGDEEALGAVERFVDVVQRTLPSDARVIKTLGDEVMVVGSDPSALASWAVRLQARTEPEEPPPRIGIHYGDAIYRDGDYYGRDVNQAARVVARAAGGEVLVTRRVVDFATALDGIRFERIGEIGLKGFDAPTELFTASARGE